MYQAEVLTDFSMGLTNFFRFIVLLLVKTTFNDYFNSFHPILKVPLPTIIQAVGAF